VKKKRIAHIKQTTLASDTLHKHNTSVCTHGNASDWLESLIPDITR
jgi:hypothetical protein